MVHTEKEKCAPRIIFKKPTLTATMFRQPEEKNTLAENIYTRLLRLLSKGSVRIKRKESKCLESQQLSLPSIL